MFRNVFKTDPAKDAGIIDEMYRARKRLFIDRLGWPLSVDDEGRETDQYDALSPVYLIDTDDRGRHRGSVRLLPTMGETLLGSRIAKVMDGVWIASPSIWEYTRFCVIGRGTWCASAAGVERVAVTLMLAICETCIEAGVEHVVGSFDRSKYEMFERNGWIPELLGQSDNGRNAIYLGMWQTTEATADVLRAALGKGDPAIGTP